MKPFRIGIAWGVWDMFHIGHLNLLKNAKDLVDGLVVCVSTDEYVMKKKGHKPVIPFGDRLMILSAIRFVDIVDRQDEEFDKQMAVFKYKPDVLIVGNDWTPETYTGEGLGVPVKYLPYTRGISSTILRKGLGYEEG